MIKLSNSSYQAWLNGTDWGVLFWIRKQLPQQHKTPKKVSTLSQIPQNHTTILPTPKSQAESNGASCHKP